jgi:hypothetical protein
MGFFSLLETFFFISLAITFVLIIMLVYHFKGRLVVLEQKSNTMFEILSSMIKEMKDIRHELTDTITEKIISLEKSQHQNSPAFSPSIPFGGAAGGLFPPELFRLFQSGPSFQGLDADEIDADADAQEFKKIIVSDTELDSDDEDYDEENDVRVITVDIVNSETENIQTDLEEAEIVLDIDEPVDESIQEELDEADEQDERDEQDEQDEQDEGKDPQSGEHIDYKKLDVSYLRTMVLTRGLATDTKKLKKSELIRLLEG